MALQQLQEEAKVLVELALVLAVCILPQLKSGKQNDAVKRRSHGKMTAGTGSKARLARPVALRVSGQGWLIVMMRTDGLSIARRTAGQEPAQYVHNHLNRPD